MAFPVNNKPTGCPIPNGQPRKTIHASNIIWIEQVIFVYVYVYINTYMNRITISKMRGQEFEGEPKQVYGSVWREKGEENNVVNI